MNTKHMRQADAAGRRRAEADSGLLPRDARELLSVRARVACARAPNLIVSLFLLNLLLLILLVSGLSFNASAHTSSPIRPTHAHRHNQSSSPPTLSTVACDGSDLFQLYSSLSGDSARASSSTELQTTSQTRAPRCCGAPSRPQLRSRAGTCLLWHPLRPRAMQLQGADQPWSAVGATIP